MHEFPNIVKKTSYEELLPALGSAFRDKYGLVIKISEQKMYFLTESRIARTWDISSGIAGAGNLSGSGKTPLGLHRIASKTGAGARIGTIFSAKQNTGRIAQIFTNDQKVPDDSVLTRVLHLEGLEEGKNRGGMVDSYARLIYIHGTPEEGYIGKPASMGCIRMRNTDVIELFDMVKTGTLVAIVE